MANTIGDSTRQKHGTMIGRRSIRMVVTVLVLLLPIALLAACSGGSKKSASLDVEVANYELIANKDNRFIAGLLTQDQDFVSYGTVGMRFSYLGTNQAELTAHFFANANATFLPLPGTAPADVPAKTSVGPATSGQGVYAVDPLHFNLPGIWQVEVTANAGGKTYKGVSAFQVLAAPQVPAEGQKALASDNFVIGSDVPPAAIDSRADSVANVPDASLHKLTISAALQQAKPLVIVFSTPVFCISRFCGPVTDMVADLQKQYADKANFIHIEIWQDFQNKKINPTAAQWLYRGEDLNEPWVFLIDKTGVIAKRWDNVVTKDEVEPALQKAIAGS